MTTSNLSRNEIRDNALRFVSEWRDESRERAEKDTFWNEFLAIFGVNRRQVATFEKAARRTSTGGGGFIDLFWPGFLIVEHKSRGSNLEEALDSQALDYLSSIPGHQYPRLVIVSDFARFRILDLDADVKERGEEIEFGIDDLPRHLDRFMYLAGYEKRSFEEQKAVNVEAAELLGRVYDELEASGYSGHDLRVLIVRLLFLLFADDARLFERDQFLLYLRNRTHEDGRDLGMHLSRLFDVLNTPANRRSTLLDEDLSRFPYVNGGLFEQRVNTPDCTRSTRDRLIEASYFDWAQISPAIFGSMFQSVMDRNERRTLGAHYTSEQNILKAIEPLFLEELNDNLEQCGVSKQKLRNFHAKLGALKFFDPACGCGNFLVIAYREIRKLETKLLRRLHTGPLQLTTDLGSIRKVSVSQFFGIEIEEFPARIAETAMYLVDHLENEALGATFGINIIDLPLTATAAIKVGNALTINWGTVIRPADCNYVFGNPPFAGPTTRNANQKSELRHIFKERYGSTLDYVTGWYMKAADYMTGTAIRAAFVSTNSITQGDQVFPLWQSMVDKGIVIDFAHRTFVWDSEAPRKAHVHCVVIGFSIGGGGKRRIYEYHDDGTSTVRKVSRINPYLHDLPDVIVKAVTKPLSPWLPPVLYGSKPADGKHLTVKCDEVPHGDEIALKYLHRYVGADELLHNKQRKCIWIPDAANAPDMLKSPFLRDRIERVRAFRESASEDTRNSANQPYSFIRNRQPKGDYVAIPIHVSANRFFYTVSHLPVEDIASNAIFTAYDPDRLIFGVLSSTMFVTWLRTVGGQIKSDLRFSNSVVYNSFPLPELRDKDRSAIQEASEKVISARASQKGVCLADLYEPLGMSSDLLAAHRLLDRAIDRIFKRRGGFKSEAERLARLFELYKSLLSTTSY